MLLSFRHVHNKPKQITPVKVETQAVSILTAFRYPPLRHSDRRTSEDHFRPQSIRLRTAFYYLFVAVVGICSSYTSRTIFSTLSPL
jgi:hypothetical protein